MTHLSPEDPHPFGDRPTLPLVESAFFASTSSLIWLVNYYFPPGPLLRIFFPVPIALAYLRWGGRNAWMTFVVTGLLSTVLMGPTRSILFLIPFGLLGLQLGMMWRRGANWWMSIGLGTLVGAIGFFFKIWLVSILLGEDLWVYLTVQVTALLDWLFLKLGLLIQPDITLVQAMAVVMILINNLIYLFVVHLVSSLLLEKLGNPIPSPPPLVDVLLESD